MCVCVFLTNFWQVFNEFVNVRLLGCPLNIAHCALFRVVAVSDVVRNAHIEQERLLTNYANVSAQPLEIHVLQIVLVAEHDRSTIGIVETLEQMN